MMVRPNVPILAFATLNVHTNAWMHVATISCCARRTRNNVASCQERLGHRNDNSRSSGTLRSSNALDISTHEPFPNLYGKTLVSIQECIDAHLHQQQQQQSRNNHSNEHHLNNNKNAPRLQFIDASWYHRPDPTTNALRNPSLEFQSKPRIPHSHYLDIDALATTYELFPRDNPKKLPHMMPPPDLFALAMDAYGIRQFAHDADGGGSVADHVVIYARRGAVFTPRTWFLFLCMGHDPKRMHLMQGSLEDWMEMGGEVEYPSFVSDTAESVVSCGEGYEDCFDGGILNVTKLYRSRGHDKTKIRYQTSVSRATNICEKDEVLRAVNEHLSLSSLSNPQNITNYLPNADIANNSKTIIIDTRGSGYSQKGHMPSAIHLPYRQLVSPSNPLVLLPKEELHDLFVSRGIRYQDPDLKIILSCGSGVSVCHAFLVLTILGRRISEENTRVYDGSWKEWGRAEEDLPRILP
ncbi:hypothetical protein HJC23_010793 [Cyclotella cryptica]|uniref:Rhodanese domain-containing protein n=1 Tax=Cyclotella cryptica TaxID=29204 RepID=A0ABD3QP95_9STRA|eukprot:CCRYP_003535-RA/>CCRYP_003535-RA protein AED:0.32 eAED:0.32 QI:0/-1/0/1/-1/1/1/0/465